MTDMTSPFESEVHDHRTDEQRKRSKLVGQRDVESTGDTWQTQGMLFAVSVGYVLICQIA